MSGTLPHPITQGDFSQRPVPGKPGHGHVLPESLQVLRRRLVASVTRLYPFYTGCGTMANCGVVRMLAGKSTGPDWVRLRQGPYLRVMLGDYLSNAVYFSRDWDRKISWVCERCFVPGTSRWISARTSGWSLARWGRWLDRRGRFMLSSPTRRSAACSRNRLSATASTMSRSIAWGSVISNRNWN